VDGEELVIIRNAAE